MNLSLRGRSTVAALRFFIVAALVASPVTAWSDALWDKALDVAQSNSDWLARTIQADAELFNNRGKSAGNGSTTIRRTLSGESVNVDVDKSGNAAPEPEGILEGGLGTPAALRTGEGVLSLFDPRHQNRITLTRLGTVERVEGGIETAVYRYSQPSPEKGTITGRVWVALKTGVPVRLVTIPAKPLSPMIANETAVTFNPDPDRWYPVRIVTDAEVRRGPVQRTLRMEITLTRYIQYKR